MTISELIKALQSVEDEHGDVTVERPDGSEVLGVSCVFQDGVRYNINEGERPPVVAVNII